MKINRRLKLNIWFSLSSIALMLLSLVWSFLEINRTAQNMLLIDKAEKAAFERIILRDDWIVYREDRARVQWYAKTDMLRKLLDQLAQKKAKADVKELLQDARADFEATASLLSAIMEINQERARGKSIKIDFTEAESRLMGQVFLKAYSLNDSISRLNENAQREAKTARNMALGLVIFFVVGGILIIGVNSITLNRIIGKRVVELDKGMDIIGGGNLGHQINADGNDELADLARACNEMTTRLKHSYASIEDLRQEIAERKLTEEKIKMLSLHEQSLITAIPDIIMEVNANKIYTWANGPGMDFFGQGVIGQSADSYFLREQNTYNVVQPIFNGSEDVIYVESWQRRQDGQERLLAWWCRVLKDAQGNVTGALSSARDVTDQRLAEFQREAALKEVRNLNEELDARVALRTAELSAKTADLERINKVFIDRELRMRELKERIVELEKT